MSRGRYLSTTEAARILGVSVATIKRWVDDSILPAHRTPGGHRKILRAELERLVHSQELPCAGPGMADPEGISPQTLRERLLQTIIAGDGPSTRRLFALAHRARIPVWVLADQVISPVMREIGHQWETSQIDVYQEHRATGLCLHGLHQLRALLDRDLLLDRPLAIGGCPEGDHYQLAALLAEMVLLQLGWKVVTLGPNTPMGSFQRALGEHRPQLLWLSVSHLADEERFLREYAQLHADCEKADVRIAVGGQALREDVCRRMKYTIFGHGLTQLADLARTLPAEATPPPVLERAGASGG